MTTHFSLFAGLAVGFSIAVPIGPMALLCIQRTLASGMRVGVCTGLGAATVNVIYGALIIAGLDRLAPLVASGARVLSFAGGLFLLWCAARTLLRERRVVKQPPACDLSPAMAYGTALAFNATNPLSPVLMIALLSPIIGPSSPSWGQAAMLLLGMFLAASAWWVCLSGGITLLRSRFSAGMLVRVNQFAGAMLTFYGALALARSAGM
jgi:threonine/homoserine/homoserine lactone efflux protein